MLRTIATPDNTSDVRVTLKTDKIGAGKLGAKSAALRALQPLIDSLTQRDGGISKGPICLPNVAITPAFWAGFLA